MSTAAEMRVLAKPILARNPDLFMHGRYLILKPLQHIAVTVLLDNNSGQTAFSPRWAMAQLFDPIDSINLNFGADIYFPAVRRAWFTSDPDVEIALGSVLERDVLPMLRGFGTIDTYEAALIDHKKYGMISSLRYRSIQQVSVDAALGRFTLANGICDEFAAGSSRWNNGMHDDKIARVVGELYPALQSGSRAKVAQVLHAWEFETVTKLKLTKHWERTPFPVEDTSCPLT